jgi:hypothetical protein
MGSLQQLRSKQSWQKRCLPNRFVNTGFAFLVIVALTSCVPATQSNHLEFFFSEGVWGGSPFDEAQKKQLFVEALKGRKTESVSKPVAFEISDSSVTVKRFDALYEVNANLGLPEVRSGYVLELDLPANAPERVTLTNTLTGVSWSVKLEKQVSSGHEQQVSSGHEQQVSSGY